MCLDDFGHDATVPKPIVAQAHREEGASVSSGEREEIEKVTASLSP